MASIGFAAMGVDQIHHGTRNPTASGPEGLVFNFLNPFAFRDNAARWLYTGITRARRLVVLVGTWRALRMAVANADPSRRESALRDRLEHRTPGSTLLGDQFELPEEDLGLPELD